MKFKYILAATLALHYPSIKTCFAATDEAIQTALEEKFGELWESVHRGCDVSFTDNIPLQIRSGNEVEAYTMFCITNSDFLKRALNKEDLQIDLMGSYRDVFPSKGKQDGPEDPNVASARIFEIKNTSATIHSSGRRIVAQKVN